MRDRTSIELHPDGCRVVVVRPTDTPDAEVRVLTVVASAADGSEASTVTEALARLRRSKGFPRRVSVTLWGLRSAHHLIGVSAGEDFEAAALARTRQSTAALVRRSEGTTVVVKDGGVRADRSTRDVSVVAASNADVRDHLQPVVDAGFTVTAVMTPALALAALARQRREPAGTAVAYVALNPSAACLAIVRDGVLLAAREMTWGHAAASAGADGAERVVAGLRRPVQHFMHASAIPVVAVRLLGDAAPLHALTPSLRKALGVDVEVLDACAGLDTRALSPGAGDAGLGGASALRLAIAAGADRTVAANLLPTSAAQAARRRYVRAAGIAAAVATGLFFAGCYWRHTSPTHWF